MTDEWAEFEERSIAKGFCPGGGGDLQPRREAEGPFDPDGDVFSCAICDCMGGYTKEEVRDAQARH